MVFTLSTHLASNCLWVSHLASNCFWVSHLATNCLWVSHLASNCLWVSHLASDLHTNPVFFVSKSFCHSLLLYFLELCEVVVFLRICQLLYPYIWASQSLYPISAHLFIQAIFFRAFDSRCISWLSCATVFCFLHFSRSVCQPIWLLICVSLPFFSHRHLLCALLFFCEFVFKVMHSSLFCRVSLSSSFVLSPFYYWVSGHEIRIGKIVWKLLAFTLL